MSSAPVARCLVEESAGLMGLRPVVAYEDRPAWLVTLDDHTLVDIEYDAAADRLVFAVGVIDMAQARSVEVYEMFLQYNYLWPETGGVRMALDGVPGQAVLMVERPVYGLTTAQMCSLLKMLARMQLAWREVLRAASAPQSQGDPRVDFLAASRDLAFSSEELLP